MAKNDTFCTSMKTYMDAKYPIMLVESSEEERACEKLLALAPTIQLPLEIQKKDERGAGMVDRHGRPVTQTEIFHPNVVEWTATKGFARLTLNTRGKVLRTSMSGPMPIQKALTEVGTREITSKFPTIFVMKDVHNLISPGNQGAIEPISVRMLRDLYTTMMGSPDSLVLLCPEMDIPNDLKKQVTIVDLPLPRVEELEAILTAALEEGSHLERYAKIVKPLLKNAKKRKQIAQSGLGMTAIEFENAVAKGFTLLNLSPAEVISEKAQVIRKSGMLTYREPTVTMEQVGGLEVYKQWLINAKARFEPEAAEYGLQPPKGILLVGPPGTGKSMLCDLTANYLELSELWFKIAGTVSKYVGQGTRNMQKGLDFAHTLAPVVLVFDEGEKFLAGTHEENTHMIGTWLTDYETHDDGVFTMMTCNDYEGLRPEVLQRFERVFYVGPPSEIERMEIFAAKIKAIESKRPYESEAFDLKALAAATPGYVGREIRTIIKESLILAYSQPNHERLETSHILDYLQTSNYKPTTVQKAEQINKMVEWANANATNASARPRDVVSRDEIGQMDAPKSRFG
jgi:AAA+ superfamily predicted ATPase